MSHEQEEIRRAVRDRYARAATQAEGSHGSAPCREEGAEAAARAIGYDDEALKDIPMGANLGLGCGNPTAIASLAPGDVVLDLGSGAGIDCFLAARRVGESGRVIGVDMTPEMVSRARASAEEGGYTNVEFRLGEIESLPVADATVDVVISNCVLNLSPEKERVLREVHRVLRPGGRVVVSDLVSDRPVPEVVAGSLDAVAGCLPTPRDHYLRQFRDAGFTDVHVADETHYPADYIMLDDGVRAFLRAHPDATEELEAFAGSIFGAHFEASKS